MKKTLDILTEIRTDALTIGNEANLSRAIPYVKDGLKPSQRAVIYGAHEQGYTSNKPHVKSLKLDGLVVGSWWPHGSEYSTITRLTQPFVMNLPLLDMHGANGSQLGTPDAAASRYTEVRLSKACEEGLLKNLAKDTCDWIPNYSEDKEWPKVLPALLPNLFVNGSDGMGYCYSQTWLPGNLMEFYLKVQEYLNTGKISYTDIYPDFPTGGIIINKKDIPALYEKGSGSIILRGRATIENNIIKITELPYQVYVTPFMEQLKNLISPNSKGEIKISGISDIYNMSGDNGMLIEIECEDNPDIILNKLYQYSNLQVSLSANQYGIIDGIPELINLEKYIKVYLEHNISTLVREYTYDLNKASERAEIVQGLLRAIDSLDDIIKIIKQSKDAQGAVTELINKLLFTSMQAQAIVDMRLGRLANMEHTNLTKELADLLATIASCKKLLSSDKLQKKEFLKRLTAFVERHAWQRRTEVIDLDLLVEKATIKQRSRVIENYSVVLDDNNQIKRILTSQIKLPKKHTFKVTTIPEDKKVILISNFGMMYKLPVKQIPKVGLNSTGGDLSTLLPLSKEEFIINVFNGEESEPNIFFITKKGLVKKTPYTEVSKLTKNIGAIVMKISEGDKIIYCELLDERLISVKYNNKTKTIDTTKFILKSRTAGGVVAVRIKNNKYITIE